MVQSERYTKPVFGFSQVFLTVFDFGFFQELPQPIYKLNQMVCPINNFLKCSKVKY